MEREALVVGINRYPILKKDPDSPAPHLTTPAIDAEEIAHLLETYGRFRVQRLPEVYTREGRRQVDPKEAVNVAQLQEAIANLFNPPDKNPPDTALLFFAGHGKRIVTGGVSEGFLATSDATLLPKTNNYGLSLNWLRDLLKISPVRQQIVWLDCCFSGELLNFEDVELLEQEKVKDRCLIAAARSFEVAYAQWGGEHGVLSGALLQALNPEQTPENWVTNYTLVDSIKQQLQTSAQKPIYLNFGGEILLTGRKDQLEPAILQGGKCPYKGLEPFDFNDEDHKYFYGRDDLVDRLLSRVKGGNFLAVVGASGSGKSSVVKAGLLYQLKLGQKLSSSDTWVIRIVRPGNNPLASLASQLSEDGLSSQARELIRGAEGLKQLVHRIAGDRRLVLVIDQFEEVFTLCQDETERQQFFEALLGALEILDNQLCVIITLRADFFGKCLEREYAGLAEKIEANPINVTPMTPYQLEEAIIKPARQVGLEVQRELVEKILEDVEGPGSLPLLQFTLTQLWSQRQVNRLTLTEYIKLGGVKETLKNQADKVYKDLTDTEKKIAERIFLELTQLGEGTEDTRRQVLKTDLVTTAQQEEVLQKLVNERLVVTSEYQVRADENKTVTMVDVAHEALIRNWEQLRQWVDENRVAIRQQRSIEEDAKEWEDKGKPVDPGLLLQGTKLATAEDYLEKHRDWESSESLVREFIQASQNYRDHLHQQENKRRKQQLLVASITTSFFTGLILFSGFQWRNTEINQILTLSESSKALLASNQQINALISHLRAGKKLNQPLLQIFPPSPQLKNEVKVTLQKVVYQVRERNHLNAGQNVNGIRASFIPDNPQQLVTVGEDGTIKLWNFQGQQLWTRRDKRSVNNNISISRDKILATAAGDDGAISLRNLKGQQLSTWKGNQGWIRSISFSPDGQLLATGGEKGARLWNLQGHELAKLESGRDWIWSVRFSPNGQLLATGGSDGTHLWNLQNRQVAKLERGQERVRSVSFSPDGQNLATGGDDGRFCLWNLRNRQLIGCKQGDSSGLWFVSFNPNSQLLATGGSSGITRFWNLEGRQVAELKGNQTAVASISFSSDGKRLAIAGDGNTVDLWDFQGQQMATMVDRQDPITDISFSPDGQQLATGGEKGTVRLWDLQGKELYKFSNHQGLLESISFSPDGQRLTTIGDEGTVRSWNLQGDKLPEEKFPVDVKNDFKCFEFRQYKCFWFSPDKRLLAGITAQGTVHVRNLQGEKLISSSTDPKNVNSYFGSLWFSSDSRLLAGLRGNGLISVWDLQDKSLKTEFSAHSGGISSVIFYSNNQRLASAGGDGTVRLRDLQGKELFKFTAYQPGAGVQSLSLSPNGQQLATVGGEDGTVRLWNFQGQQVAEFPANARRVVFSPDSQRIATIAYDGTAQLWQIETFEELMKRGCNWVRDHLENNQTVEKGDKHLCNGIRQE